MKRIINLADKKEVG